MFDVTSKITTAICRPLYTKAPLSKNCYSFDRIVRLISCICKPFEPRWTVWYNLGSGSNNSSIPLMILSCIELFEHWVSYLRSLFDPMLYWTIISVFDYFLSSATVYSSMEYTCSRSVITVDITRNHQELTLSFVSEFKRGESTFIPVIGRVELNSNNITWGREGNLIQWVKDHKS